MTFTYKSIAKAHFKKPFKKCVCLGWFEGEPPIEAITNGGKAKAVEHTNQAEGLDPATTPYSVLRYSYTDWGVYQDDQIGVVVKQAAFQGQLFLFYNNEEAKNEAIERGITAGYFTRRRKQTVKDVSHIRWK